MPGPCAERARLGRNGSGTAGAAAAPAPAIGGDAERVAAVAKLQQDTEAKFKAIQSQAVVPAAAAPPKSDEDLAWGGGKLCGLKPPYRMKLKAEALQLVRIDAAPDRIILSEFAGGACQEVALDGNGFAQRATFNANAIGQGGDSCGRAFWNAEAYQAASAAMSGG